MKILFMGSSNDVGLTFNLSMLAINLAKVGNIVNVLTPSKEQVKGLRDKLFQNDVKIIKLESIDNNSIGSILSDSRSIKKAIKENGIEVVHTNGTLQFIKAHLACRGLAGKRPALTITYHSSFLFLSKKGRMAMKYCGKRADLVIPLCKDSRDSLLKLGVPSDRMAIIPNGIDLKEFDERGIASDEKVSTIFEETSGKKVVAYVAVLRELKGHEDYLQAAKIVLDQYPDVVFLVVGDGPRKEYLLKYSEDLGINKSVIFTGMIDATSLPFLLGRVDIGVSASLAEQFPYNILELMAAGKPVVATNVGAIPDIMADGLTGFLTDPGDPEQLAHRISALIMDDGLSHEMGRRGREVMEAKFDLPIVAQMLSDHYTVVLGRMKRS